MLVGAAGAPGAEDCDSSVLGSLSPTALTAPTANLYSVPPDTVSDADVAELAAYLRATRTDKPAWPDLKKKVAAIRAQGK